MLYAYLAVAVSLFLAGFGSGYKYEQANTERLKLGIERSNAEAAAVLEAAKANVARADGAAQQLATQLEKTHETTLTTINAMRDRSSDVIRLYNAAHRQDCNNPVPDAAHTGQLEAETGRAAIPEGIGNLAYRADLAAAYAQECWAYVTNNCGIVEQAPLERLELE